MRNKDGLWVTGGRAKLDAWFLEWFPDLGGPWEGPSRLASKSLGNCMYLSLILSLYPSSSNPDWKNSMLEKVSQTNLSKRSLPAVELPQVSPRLSPYQFPKLRPALVTTALSLPPRHPSVLPALGR